MLKGSSRRSAEVNGVEDYRQQGRNEQRAASVPVGTSGMGEERARGRGSSTRADDTREGV